jgi:dihydrofolate reductase
MRKLILQMQVSVDSYVGRAGEGPNWQVWDWGPRCPWDDPLKARFNAVFRDIDTILLSRRIVDARKVVFSKTLQNTQWARTELARRPLLEEVDALKAESGRDLIAFGGAGFASALIANDLVDEYQFYVNPIALGEGLRLRNRRHSLRPTPPAGPCFGQIWRLGDDRCLY